MKKYICIFLAATTALSACNKFLDLKPESSLSPAQYLTTEDNVASYATDLYNVLPVHGETSWGIWKNDAATDNMAYSDPSDIFAPGYWKVGQTGGSWSFTEIYRCNYFFDNVLENFQAGKITGSADNIRHYIGEVYFFRAWCYFVKLKALGDFPIVTTCLGDDLDELTQASIRQPRNVVARFILEDLDTAIGLLKDVPPKGGSNRISRDCAHMLKSRVALYEGTWEKYFKGTAFVPGTPSWPGASTWPDFAYEGGDIDSEIEYFLGIAMEESKIIADKYPLTENTGQFQNSASATPNPYFDMFGAEDMSAYPEVLLWKQYSVSEGVTNSVVEFAAAGNQGYGTTKSMVDAFVMESGIPIYASALYPGDADLLRVTEGRDSRARLFIKRPGDTNLHSDSGPESYMIEPWPNLVNSTASMKYSTGYALRKGLNFDGAQSNRNKSVVGCIIFRAAEAYLNYIEACYEKTGAIDSDADKYWRAIRKRAGIAEDYNVTINATDITKENKTDWGAWSAGVLVDKTLFNIRRERRCELMAEGFRPDDVRRWRAMDQMIDVPYHPLGVNLWASLATNPDFLAMNNNNLRENENVSPRSFSNYYAPYHILANNRVYDGYRWNMAHYLDPIAVQHFLITGGGTVEGSVLYQNPGWPTRAGQGAK